MYRTISIACSSLKEFYSCSKSDNYVSNRAVIFAEIVEIEVVRPVSS
jgi:hypothetical protein